MKLIVGIGNPDPEYLQTRHNVGWIFLDWLAQQYPAGGAGEIMIGETTVTLLKPDTYVNKTGEAVKKAKVKPQDLIVVQDDLDIPFGMCKLSYDKNSGGHKGIESIMTALKTKKFYRIRIGLGVPALAKARAKSAEERDEWVRDFVLKKFTPAEQKKLKEVFEACQVRLLNIL